MNGKRDVAVYEITTGIIDHFAGVSLPLSGSFYTAGQRLETVQARLNNHYAAVVVPAGMYQKGDVYTRKGKRRSDGKAN